MKNTYLFVASALCIWASEATAQSTINSTDKYAYSANTGWINCRPSSGDGVVVGEAFLSGYAYGANIGWIDMGDGTPANGYSYANNSASDYGVNHNGAGDLSGMAYSANTGWINFGWASLSDPNRPRVNLLTGQLTGYVWGANIGWISLDTGSSDLVTDTLACPDIDTDGIADAWEMLHFGTLATAGVGTDTDKDGESDASEYGADTDPDDAAEYLHIVSQNYNAGMTQVTLDFATTGPTRLYRIQESTSLLSAGPGSWADVGSLGTFLADPGATTSKTFTFAGGPWYFFRAVALKPLQP